MADEKYPEIDDESDDEADAEALGCTAKLEVRYVGKMSASQRQDIIDWLHRQGEQLLTQGDDYAVLFTAKLDPED